MLGVTFELAHLQRVAVDVGKEAACRLAVEAGGRDEHVALFFAFGPGARVELDPVVPALPGREGREVDPAGTGIEGLPARLGLGSGGLDALVQPAELLVHRHASDTD